MSFFIANEKIANSINDSVSVRSLCSCKISKAMLVLNSDAAFEYRKNYSNQSLANSFDLFKTLWFIFEKVGSYSPPSPLVPQCLSLSDLWSATKSLLAGQRLSASGLDECSLNIGTVPISTFFHS